MIQSSLSKFPTVQYSEAEVLIADKILDLHLKNNEEEVEKGMMLFASAVAVSTAIAFKFPASLIVSVPVTLGVGVLKGAKKLEYDLKKNKINKIVFMYVKVFSEKNKEDSNKKINAIFLAEEAINLAEGNL